MTETYEEVDLATLTDDQLDVVAADRKHAAFDAVGSPNFAEIIDRYKAAVDEKVRRNGALRARIEELKAHL